jgi:hypothetical protein
MSRTMENEPTGRRMCSSSITSRDLHVGRIEWRGTPTLAATLWGVLSCSSGHTGVSSPGVSAADGSPEVVALEDAAPIGTSPSLACESASACVPGQVCCGHMDMTSSCVIGPCEGIPALGRPVQLCATSVECAAGQTCSLTSLPIPQGALLACNPLDAGSDAETGPSPEGASAVDALPAEASDAADSSSTRVGANEGD